MRKINANFLQVLKTGSTNKTLCHERNMQNVRSLPRRTRSKAKSVSEESLQVSSQKLFGGEKNTSTTTRQSILCEQPSGRNGKAL
jgi:hypothetical protein